MNEQDEFNKDPYQIDTGDDIPEEEDYSYLEEDFDEDKDDIDIDDDFLEFDQVEEKRLVLSSGTRKRVKEIRREKLLKEREGTELLMSSFMTLSNMSALIGDTPVNIAKFLLSIDECPKNSYMPLPKEAIYLILNKYKRIPVEQDEMEKDFFQRYVPKEGDPFRPPVVTIMGHVNHGKTTLLDSLRKKSKNIADQEAGKITQHVCAFPVKFGDSYVSFVDTPGHAAFEGMRQRGIAVADVVILVIAVDKGVENQTKTIVEYLVEHQIPTIVALNKIDKKKTRYAEIENDLERLGMIVESKGGTTPCVKISALYKQGLEEMLEVILFTAEMLELKGDPEVKPEIQSFEYQHNPYLGGVVNGIVKSGTLHRGDVIGNEKAFGKIKRILFDGAEVEVATPGHCVSLVGFKSYVEPGAYLMQMPSLKAAEKFAQYAGNRIPKEKRAIIELERSLKESYEMETELRDRIEALEWGIDEEVHVAAKRREREQNESVMVPFILKADVTGTMEVIEKIINLLPNDEFMPTIIKRELGPVSRGDVELAYFTNPPANILAFNVPYAADIRERALGYGIAVGQHDIIYHVLDWVNAIISKKLPREEVVQTVASGEILAKFMISHNGSKLPVAGVSISRGTVRIGSPVRVLRDGEQLFEGKIRQLRHGKTPVEEMKSGTECGILLSDEFGGFEPGDTIETIRRTYKERSLLSEADKAEFWAKVTRNAQQRKHQELVSQLD